MTDEDKIKNIITFLFIIFCGAEINPEVRNLLIVAIMEIPPDYFIEKFERYVLSNMKEHPWGLHLSLRNSVFNRYCKKWKLNEDQYGK
jgi:hypothetical protein